MRKQNWDTVRIRDKFLLDMPPFGIYVVIVLARPTSFSGTYKCTVSNLFLHALSSFLQTLFIDLVKPKVKGKNILVPP